MSSIVKEKIIISSETQTSGNKSLWTLNFFLLWQGQLLSMFGDAVYSIALGFWILQTTGSTAMMGFLMGAAVIPRIFLSPIGGTFVDRHNRKKIIIATDLLRGVVITGIGVAAIIGFIQVWMVLIAGVILGICGSFFNPAVSSAIPDIVDKKHLVKANSALSLLSKGSDILGKLLGGMAFQIIGAPVLFLINGLSYLFSGVSEAFIHIPHHPKEVRQTSFLQDMKFGIKYVNGFQGLKYLYITIAFLNFFGTIGIMLLLPLFNQAQFLNAQKYGVAMAVFSVGMFLGFLMLSSLDLDKVKRSYLFTVSGMMNAFAMISVAVSNSLLQIVVSLFLSGMSIAVTNVLIQSCIQAAVPVDMRGKVSGFRATLNSSLVPVAMALGGVLAEVISVRLIIGVSYFFMLVLFIILLFIKPVMDLIDFK